MRKVVRSDKSRFKKAISDGRSAVVVSLPCMTRSVLEKYTNLVRKYHVKSEMILKRLFYKVYISDKRQKNEKVPYQNNLHLILPSENSNYRFFSVLNSYGGKIVGVLHNNKFDSKAALYMKSKFNSNAAALILLCKLVTAVALAAKNSKILNKDK